MWRSPKGFDNPKYPHWGTIGYCFGFGNDLMFELKGAAK